MAAGQSDWDDRIGKRLRLRDLYVLTAVVRWGSMAKAASHLGMSQPAVSEAIAGLEKALRVSLLERNAKGVKPTIYADALLKRGEVVFDELRQGIKEIEFLANPHAGEVRIACPEFLSAELLAEAISDFSSIYPRVVFSVVQQDTSTLDIRELQERVVDIVFTRIPNTFADDDLNVEVLFADQQYIIAGARSPWARKRGITLADLAEAPWILPPSSIIQNLVRSEFEAQGLRMGDVSINAASLLLRNRLLSTGRYLSVMPQSVLTRNARQWSLKALDVSLTLRSPPVSLVTLKRRTLSPAVKLFVEHIRAAAKAMAPTSGQAKS